MYALSLSLSPLSPFLALSCSHSPSHSLALPFTLSCSFSLRLSEFTQGTYIDNVSLGAYGLHFVTTSHPLPTPTHTLSPAALKTTPSCPYGPSLPLLFTRPPSPLSLSSMLTPHCVPAHSRGRTLAPCLILTHYPSSPGDGGGGGVLGMSRGRWGWR